MQWVEVPEWDQNLPPHAPMHTISLPVEGMLTAASVGRPAVSRYHQISKFFAEGEGPDYAVHDFPNAAYGIKLGGFMVRGGQTEDGKARYLD